MFLVPATHQRRIRQLLLRPKATRSQQRPQTALHLNHHHLDLVLLRLQENQVDSQPLLSPNFLPHQQEVLTKHLIHSLVGLTTNHPKETQALINPQATVGTPPVEALINLHLALIQTAMDSVLGLSKPLATLLLQIHLAIQFKQI